MLEVVAGVVRSLDVDYLEVSWNIRETGEDVLDYDFQVWRSESPEGVFDPISAPFQDRYWFIDNATKSFMMNRLLYYRVSVTDRVSGQVVNYGPFTAEAKPDLVASELRRHMQLLFQEFNGRKCWALPIRTFGQRCTCWDSSLQQRTRSGCQTCFDTGFIRGYHSPIEVWAQIEPNSKNTQPTNIGELIQSNSTMRIVYPSLKPRDIIIEGENRRWRIVTVAQTEHGRAAVHQEVQIQEIPHSDIEYKIPLRMDVAIRDQFFSPKRNYTNPQNLGNLSPDDFANVFGTYQRKSY